MKRAELFFNIAAIPVDIVSLLLAGLFSFHLRLRLDSIIPVKTVPVLQDYIKMLGVVIPIMLLIFAFQGLYNLRSTRKFSKEFLGIITSISIALFVIILIFFFDQKFFPSRLIILSAWFIGIAFVTLGRFLLSRIQKYFLRRGKGLHRLVIVKEPGIENPLVEYIEKNSDLGYKVTAVLESSPGLYGELDRLYREGSMEEILHFNTNSSYEENMKLFQYARQKGLNFSYVPNLFDVQKNIVSTENVQGTPVILLKNTPLVGWGRVAKRIFDVIVSVICLVLVSPIYLFLAIWIKLDSPGRIHYAVLRAGRDKDFIFYKLRSMYSHLSNGEEYGGEEADKLREEMKKNSVRGDSPIPKFKDDPRVTKIGRFIRKTKLDEIPQFWNVLKGDMSMVGPRAHMLDEVEKYRDAHQRLFTIKPGIFGLTQIAQMKWPDLPFEEEVRLNTFYIENWSIWLDIKTLIKTFYYLFFGKKDNGDY